MMTFDFFVSLIQRLLLLSTVPIRSIFPLPNFCIFVILTYTSVLRCGKVIASFVGFLFFLVRSGFHLGTLPWMLLLPTLFLTVEH